MSCPNTVRVAAERSRDARLRRWIVAPLLVLVAACAAVRAADESAWSTLAPLASRALLLDAQVSEGRIVAVGERGNILLSDDDGKDWRQVLAPTRATLTGVAFGGNGHVVAVGHLGTVLVSSDRGESWKRVSTDATEEDSFLDVIFLDERTALAVGAYGLFMQSDDAGATWARRTISDDGFHYNRIARAGDMLLIVGEAGTTLRSLDNGADWEAVPTPYEGSFFGIVYLGAEGVVICGLRGRTYQSLSQGDDWEAVNIPGETLLMSGLKLADGRILLAGQSGNFVLADRQLRAPRIWKWGASTGVAEVLQAPDGALLVFGEAGVVRVALPPIGKDGAK